MERLAKFDPGNASWQHDLMVVCAKTRRCRSGTGTAGMLHMSALAIATDMQAKGHFLAPSDAWIPLHLPDQIAQLKQ